MLTTEAFSRSRSGEWTLRQIHDHNSGKYERGADEGPTSISIWHAWRCSTSASADVSAIAGLPSTTTLAAAFKARGAAFVDISSGVETQANSLSTATSSALPPIAFGAVGIRPTGCTLSQCCTGLSGVGRAPAASRLCPLDYLVATNGTGVAPAIVSGLQALFTGTKLDVTARAVNDPTNAGGVDAAAFISAIRAKDEGDATAGCAAMAAMDTNGDGIKDTFSQVALGAPVCFEVIPKANTTVPGAANGQTYRAKIATVSNDVRALALGNHDITFFVPAAP